MDSNGQSLLKLLFNEGETVCVSDSSAAYHSIPLKNALGPKVTLVSPNEKFGIRECDSDNLTMVAINPISGWRRDNQVTGFRSFLVEIDVGSLQEQLATVKHMRLPYSAQVFSGSKSVHTIITLDEDLKDEKIWRFTNQWILNIMTMADQNCKNPSRSTRIPGARREENKLQRLIKLNGRISQKELMDWLNKYEHLRPRAKEKREYHGNADYSRLSPWAKWQLKNGVNTEELGRNQTFFGLGVDFALAGFSEEQAIENLGKYYQEEHDFKEKEWLTTINSAFKYVNEGKAKK